MIRVLTIAGAALALGASFPAYAQNVQDGTMRVKLAGVDLQGGNGAQIALKRIETAAQTYCGAPSQRFFDTAVAQCRAEMTARAVDQLGAPLVTALYQESGPNRILLARR